MKKIKRGHLIYGRPLDKLKLMAEFNNTTITLLLNKMIDESYLSVRLKIKYKNHYIKFE